MPPSRPVSTASLTALWCVVLLTALLTGAPLSTDDLWWHLEAGEAYAAQGPWPDADPTLHTARDEAPIQHEWLFGVAVHLIEARLGFSGLRLAHLLLALASLGLVFFIVRRATRSSSSACLAVCFFAVLSSNRLTQLRPDLVSFVATFAGYRLLVEAERVSWARVGGFAALIALWANFHSLFMLGVNLQIAALLGLLLHCLLARATPAASPAEVTPTLGKWTWALLIALTAALLNPRGIAQHASFLSASQEAAIWRIADEWSPFHPFVPSANHPSITTPIWALASASLAAFAAAAAFTTASFVRRRSAETLRAFDAVHLGLALAAALAMLVSIRFLWLGFFPLLYALRSLARLPAGALPWRDAALAIASVALAASLLLGHGIADIVRRFGEAPLAYLSTPYRAHRYHAEAVDFLARAGLEGRLYNPYWMGGFLGYWLAPRLRVFIDGRTEHYAPSVFDDYASVLQMAGTAPEESMLDVLERRRVEVFLGVGFPGWWHGVYTTTSLERVPGWVLLSRGYRHAVYLRRNAANAVNLERAARYYRDRGIAFDSAQGLDPDLVVSVHPHWAMAHGMLPPEYPALRAQLAAPSGAERLHAARVLATLYLLNGAYRAQTSLDARLASDFPAEPEILQRLVYGHLRLREPERAGGYLERLRDADPEGPRTGRLARLLADYRAIDAAGHAEEGDKQVVLNRLLATLFPATAAETWAIEHRVETEHHRLERAHRSR